MQVAELVTT